MGVFAYETPHPTAPSRVWAWCWGYGEIRPGVQGGSLRGVAGAQVSALRLMAARPATMRTAVMPVMIAMAVAVKGSPVMTMGRLG